MSGEAPFADREHIQLTSPHTEFDTYLVVDDQNRVVVERVKPVQTIPQPAGPPPAPVWNETTGQWELSGGSA